MAGLFAWGESREKSRVVWSGWRLNWPTEDCRAVWKTPLLNECLLQGVQSPPKPDMWRPRSIHHCGERVYLPPEGHQILHQAAGSGSACPCAGCCLKRCSCVCSKGQTAADKSYSQAISLKRPVKAAIAVLHCIHV